MQTTKTKITDRGNLVRLAWVGAGSAGKMKEVFSNKGERTDAWISVVVTLTNLTATAINVTMARNSRKIFDITQTPTNLKAELDEQAYEVIRKGSEVPNGRVVLALADYRCKGLKLDPGDEVAFELVLNDEETIYALSDAAGLVVNVDFTG